MHITHTWVDISVKTKTETERKTKKKNIGIACLFASHFALTAAENKTIHQ